MSIDNARKILHRLESKIAAEKIKRGQIDNNIWIVYIILGAFFWPLAINPWLVYFGKAAKVVWWHGLIIGVVSERLKGYSITAAILTYYVLYLLED